MQKNYALLCVIIEIFMLLSKKNWFQNYEVLKIGVHFPPIFSAP